MSRAKYWVYVILIPLLIFNHFSALAQQVSIDSLLVKAFASDVLLPRLIDSAIKYSPQAKMSRSNEVMALANYSIHKKSFYNAISIHSSYGYGTNYSSVNNQSSTVGNNLTTGQSAFYNIGLGLQLPITQIINRKDIRKVEQATVALAVDDKNKTELTIKQDVVKLYQELKLLQKMVAVSSVNKQAAEVNNMLAEKNFLNGQISVEQASAVLENYNHAVLSYETYVNSFQSGYMLLEIYIGTSLSALIKTVK